MELTAGEDAVIIVEMTVGFATLPSSVENLSGWEKTDSNFDGSSTVGLKCYQTSL
jgi:hypothetical protein